MILNGAFHYDSSIHENVLNIFISDFDDIPDYL